jgi:hypothetical protein
VVCDGPSYPNQEYKMTRDGDMGLWLVWVMFCAIAVREKVLDLSALR